ncbi:MAG TPA: hypothetical protein DCW29_20070, partial [Janthinobacterium sp.]|nr:hypothetical protein [Janthinobacterium sp.]
HNGGHNGGHGFVGHGFAGRGFHEHGFHDHGFRGRGHVGVFVGAPLFWYGYDPFWYGYPYHGYPYYQAPPSAAYVEQGLNPAPAQWYYCSQPAGYYPYVKNCLTAWRAVTPPVK